jgi:hypothetical protein
MSPAEIVINGENVDVIEILVTIAVIVLLVWLIVTVVRKL